MFQEKEASLLPLLIIGSSLLRYSNINIVRNALCPSYYKDTLKYLIIMAIALGIVLTDTVLQRERGALSLPHKSTLGRVQYSLSYVV